MNASLNGKLKYFHLIEIFSLRYLAVVFPVSSKVLRTKFNTQVAISVSWAVSLLLSCPALFLHGLLEIFMKYFLSI